MFLRRALLLCLAFTSIVTYMNAEETEADHDHEHDHADIYKDPEASNETCKKNGDGNCIDDEEEFELYRLDGVKVGYSKKVKLMPDRFHHINTLNMIKPLILEIPEFVTDEEAEYLINYAEEKGMQEALVKLEARNRIVIRDLDGNQELTTDEMRFTLEDSFFLFFDERDLFKIYDTTELDKDHDDILTKEELEGYGMEEFQKLILGRAEEWPLVQPSKYQYINVKKTDDDVINRIKDRIAKLLRLPNSIVKNGDLHIDKYNEGGYQSGHIDSSPRAQHLPCCHQTDASKCRGCRYASLEIYLSDVEDGGESTFQIANNETFDDETFLRSSCRNMATKCHKSKLHFKPEKGKALVWYNHFVDGETGGLGEIDVYAWHGECPVIAGTKWVLTFEINVDDNSKAGE
ncbi:transmembrane prolyl 4-hydroxylase-like [Glandiceps talaboti]